MHYQYWIYGYGKFLFISQNNMNWNWFNIVYYISGFYGRPWSSDQRKLLFKWLVFIGYFASIISRFYFETFEDVVFLPPLQQKSYQNYRYDYSFIIPTWYILFERKKYAVIDFSSGPRPVKIDSDQWLLPIFFNRIYKYSNFEVFWLVNSKV